MMLAAVQSVRLRHIGQLIRDEKEVLSVEVSGLLLTLCCPPEEVTLHYC